MSTEYSTLMDDLVTALGAAAPRGRAISRTLKDRDQYRDIDLQGGVFTVISAGHRSFIDFVGGSAQYGAHRALVIGQVMVAQNGSGADLENAEFSLFEEVRAMVRSTLPATLSPMKIVEFRQSGQVDHPYGWIAVTLDIGTD